MYSNGKIYKLQCADGYFYIGSTCSDLTTRLKNHKSVCNNRDSKLYKHIKTISWNDVSIVLLEDFPSETKLDLRKRENEYIEKEISNPLCLNTIMTLRDHDKRLKKGREYAREHKDEQKQYHKIWRETNKQKWLQHLKKYRDSHKEQTAEYQRNYYQKKKG